MPLGGNLKIIRKKWKMNQTEFGVLINASQFDISSYEKEKYEPKIPAVIRLEELTGIAVARLYGEVIDVKEVPNAPLQSYQTPSSNPNIVAESQPFYQPRKVKEGDLIDVLKLVDTVKFLEQKVKQLSQQLKELSEQVNDWRNRRH